MNKEEFLSDLNAHLKKLPVEERQEILQDFKEHFTIGVEEGKSEEEIAASLGSPQMIAQAIAKEMVANHHLGKVEATTTTGNMFRAVWAVIGLGFFNLVIVLGPFVALLGIVIAGWATGVACITSPLLVLINAIFFPGTYEVYEFFLSMVLCGLGLFIIIGMFFATKAVTNSFIRYLRYNVRLVKGGLKYD